MNVLILADYGSPKSGNFIPSLLELAEYMRKDKNRVYFSFKKKDEERFQWREWIKEHNLQIIDIDEENNCVEQLNYIIEKYKIDIIHSHFGYLHKVLVKNAGKFKKEVKIIFHDHMDYSAEQNINKQKCRQILYSFIYRIQKIKVISVAEEKDNGYFFVGKKAHWHVPNGLSYKRNIKCSMSSEKCRELLGVKPDEKICLFLGWDIKRKGLDIAIKAVDELCTKGEKILLAVAGLGNNPSDETRRYLKELAGTHYKEKNILYLKSTEDMYAYHRAADVYLSASRSEAFSYGLLEAISQNTPVVVSDIEGTSWSWKYDKCFKYKVENEKSCANALKEAIEIGRRDSNYKEIAECYSIQKWCNQIMDIYKQVLN